ncbi:HNH endonuclease [Demequina oxidasica]|uniref:HNH endonuclease n=1 Tax=Demequina oxidasica TaxID=676199 RepID=UPI00078458FB|nr:HNH endonuclease signature motif containing protein [Demequina oxidasica]
MTISLGTLVAEVEALRAFEGREESELTSAELHEYTAGMGRVKKSYDGAAAGMSCEVARRSTPELGAAGLARKEGFSNPQQYLADTLGTTPTEASKLIDAGRALTPLPPSSDDLCALAGQSPPEKVPPAPLREVSAGPRFPYIARALQAQAIAADAAASITRTLEAVARSLAEKRAATRDPHLDGGGSPLSQADRDSIRTDLAELERRLVEKAQTLSLSELRKVCERERAWRFPKELAAKEKLHRENRALYFHEDADGMTVMTARMDAASAAPIKAYVDAQTRWAFQQRRSVEDGGRGIDDARSAGQIRIDALTALALHGMGCETPTSGVKTTVVVRVDEQDLKDDLALGECDEIASPITVSTLRAMAVDAAILPVTMGGKSLPLDLGRTRRLFTPAQRLALVERDGGCSWCHAPPSFCEAHHIRWWDRDGGRTDLANGVLLCTRCHHRVHRDGWKIEVNDGQVWITKPGEPDRGIQDKARTPRPGGKAHLALTRSPQTRVTNSSAALSR